MSVSDITATTLYEALDPGEHLLWTGHPDPTHLLFFAIPVFVFAFLGAWLFLLALLIPAALLLRHGRDHYALTDRRILRLCQPLGAAAQLKSLPRAGTHVSPDFLGSKVGLIFTAPDHRSLSFPYLSRADRRLLIATYPSGGPPKGRAV